MAGQNQYLTFAGSGGANTLTPAAWAALTTLLANGFQSGLASSQQVNTLFRQLTTVAAAVGKLVSDSNQDALDDANYQNLALAIRNAVSANSGLQSLSVAPSSNNMVITVQPSTLGFRNTSLATGTITNVTSTSPLTLTIPSGATLGTANGVLSRIVVLAINNGGTMELAVKNIAGAQALDEMGVISTSSIVAGATSATTFYSQVARSNVAYRVVGVFDSTQATAGTYVTAPSLVQAAGGLALANLTDIGVGSDWVDVTASRVLGTTYTNTSGRTLALSIRTKSTNSSSCTVTVNGKAIAYRWGGDSFAPSIPIFAMVPPGGTYNIASTVALDYWFEL